MSYTNTITKEELQAFYLQDKLSMKDIAGRLDCSVNRIVYWMKKYEIERRSISEAVYQKHNPFGDPFRIKPIKTLADAKLFGLGVGLYWGEGNRANQYSVRLGNTDPELIKQFMNFLIDLFGVMKEDLKFSLQIFSDINPENALQFWIKELGVKLSQFYKVTVTISGSLGTYRKKSKYGVVTVYFHNKKLRDILVATLPR